MDDISTDHIAEHADAGLTAGPEKPPWVVGIGAGAGGLEAIQLLLGAMPADAGLAFVICRRVQSGLSDPLADLLCTQTAMPVVQAEEGMVLEAGRVHVLPPDARMVLLKDRLVHFRAGIEEGDAEAAVYDAVSPIDMLLYSLAASAGPTAIAVILSGNQEDGLRGCASIRDHGGLVLAQHPESTEFAAMPGGVIDADLASEIAPPGALADLIRRHAGRTRKPAAERSESGGDDDALARITAMLAARFSIDAHAYRPSLVAKRVRRRLALSKAASLADYADLLAGDAAELSALHDDLSIRVTAFFRDPEAFAVLERDVVPSLIGRMSSERPIRVWVPGCASGEEAYSIGMLLLDRIDRAGKDVHLEIIASDRHVPAIEQARSGRYRRDQVGETPSALIERFMENGGEHVEVGPRLRRHVTFVDHDLLKAPPPDDIDLVSCRNVLIYLAAASCEKALRACYDALKPGGFLFLGPSEQPRPRMPELATIDGKWRIFRKPAPPPVDETLKRLSAAYRQKPAEAIHRPEDQGAGQPPRQGASPNDAGSVTADKHQMLESTIDTLLASNDMLRRRNRDLRAENQRLTHAHAALDDVATMIAHDLKAPLRAVANLAERLGATLAGEKPGPDALRWLQPMQHRLAALNRLIDDLLAYARQGPADAADLRPVDFGDLLRETLMLIGLPKGVRVLVMPPSLQVMTWPIPLACILRSLLSQTIERIGAAAGTIRIEATCAGCSLQIVIADSGHETDDRTGELGLAIVRQFLDAAGGQLTSGTSTPGPGREVRFTWPIKGKITPKTSRTIESTA